MSKSLSATVARASAGCALAVAALTLCACNGDEPRTASVAAPQGASPDVRESAEIPGAGQSSESTPLPAICLLAGGDESEREFLFSDVVGGYLVETEGCRTRALTSTMSSDQLADWANYLLNYTSALFGCGLLFSPLPGGVEAFGLGNTEVVGVPGPMLGPDDASFLIDTYLSSCTNQLAIPSDDLAAMREHLERAATSRIDPSLSARLSDCP